eukprot:scaffold148_cov371-Prasinococcus_capsulatus_cf.AAC.20
MPRKNRRGRRARGSSSGAPLAAAVDSQRKRTPRAAQSSLAPFELEAEVVERLQLSEALSHRLLYPAAARELELLLHCSYLRSNKHVQAVLFDLALRALGDCIEALSKRNGYDTLQASAALSLHRTAVRTFPKQRKLTVAAAYKHACLRHARRAQKRQRSSGSSSRGVAQLAPADDIDDEDVEMPCTMPDLPREVRLCVASFLDLRSLSCLACVDTSWKHLLRDEGHLWYWECRKLCEREGARPFPLRGSAFERPGKLLSPPWPRILQLFAQENTAQTGRLLAARARCSRCEQLVWRYSDSARVCLFLGSSKAGVGCICHSANNHAASWGQRPENVVRWAMKESTRTRRSGRKIRQEDPLSSSSSAPSSESDSLRASSSCDSDPEDHMAMTPAAKRFPLGRLWHQMQMNSSARELAGDNGLDKRSSKAAIRLITFAQDCLADGGLTAAFE